MSILVLPTGSHDEDPYLVITSPQPATGRGWNAEVVSGDTDVNALQSATISGTTRTLVVDLRNHAGAFGSGKFKADVHIVMTVSQTPPTRPIILSAQHCDWENAVSAGSSAPSQSSNAQVPGAQACGVGDLSVLCPMEQAFIDDLETVGITPARTPRDLVNLGWRLCGLLSNHSRDAVVQGAFNDGKLSLKECQDLVDIANGRLCPQF
ncbi:DUF732 domain-containing protein [Mycobacterium sp. GA-1199]|uniref:DUF732 domain-containing protein n=1 Tax=Mycobacterium sp. GA-1199 TaxID=1772287 RepID=UPI0009E6BC99|nr:DUF732 domain-containing protein [Mycobacterium sp. GA-1199]